MAKLVRCAVYTRKSSDEGLEQSFNSLHAQREACEAYILSQKHEGWQLVPTAYDDGGFSGGTMERPGLKALMADLEAGLIDIIVVYKVDRLTRSLADFAKMVERFDAKSASFVSITQAFNTTTSMGRLTLNVLLSFAQFEREVTGERIRDKIAASKAKGMWMGGMVPLGYDAIDRQLVVNEAEAANVRKLFELYRKLKTVDAVVARAAKLGIKAKLRINKAGEPIGGEKLGRGALYRIFANPIYAGEIGHGDKRYEGQHEAIVDRKLFEAVQKIMSANRNKQRGAKTSADTPLLAGLVQDDDGTKLISTHTNKAGRRYRYYAGGARRIPAGDLEEVVISALLERLGNTEQFAALLPDVGVLSLKVLNAAQQTATVLAADDPLTIRATFLKLITAVIVTETTIAIGMNLGTIGLDGVTPTISLASTIGKVKAKLTLVLPSAVKANPDRALIGVVAQAREWLTMLTGGKVTSLDMLAAKVGVTPAYVRQHIGAAFLAPDLVTTIVGGRQPASMTASTLQAMLPLPAEWSKQRELFASLN